MRGKSKSRSKAKKASKPPLDPLSALLKKSARSSKAFVAIFTHAGQLVMSAGGKDLDFHSIGSLAVAAASALKQVHKLAKLPVANAVGSDRLWVAIEKNYVVLASELRISPAALKPALRKVEKEISKAISNEELSVTEALVDQSFNGPFGGI